MIRLSKDALLVLTYLPREPAGACVADLAEDCFPDDRVPRGRVRRALRELGKVLHIKHTNHTDEARGWRTHYSVAADSWEKAMILSRQWFEAGGN